MSLEKKIIKLVKKKEHQQLDDIPKNNLKTSLYPHQIEFLNKASKWEKEGHGGLLGAEMGTGKTLMILSLFAESNQIKKTLVIAPLALLENWRNEFHKHLNLPRSKIVIYHGPKRQQIDLHDRLMVITTYETARQDIVRWSSMSPLIDIFNPDRIVLDEAHEIKNPESKRFKAIMKLSQFCECNYNWAMTGTPIHNRVNDIISLARFIDLEPYNNDNWWKNCTQEKLEEWRNASYIYFSIKEINLKLPDKIEHHHHLRFSDDEDEIYQQISINAQQAFMEYLDGKELFTNVLTKILRLKQCCNHVYAPFDEDKIDMPFKDSAKTNKLIQIINNTPDNEKIVVFTQFRGTMNIIADSLVENGYQNKFIMYHGGLNSMQKNIALQNFSNNNNCKILLMSIKAGGVGLNIVEANHVVIFDLWWNKAIEEQAIARVHRIGQTKEVQVHKITIKESIEDWILGLQERKQQCANNILIGDINQAANFTKEDLKKLFKSYS